MTFKEVLTELKKVEPKKVEQVQSIGEKSTTEG
jgi:hypothetical protein